MACARCASENQMEFGGEINLHFPGLNGINKPSVLLFPQVLVCLDCGIAEFPVPQKELLRLGFFANHERNPRPR